MIKMNSLGKAPLVSAPDEVQVRVTFSGMGHYMIVSERDNKPVAALDLLTCGQALILLSREFPPTVSTRSFDRWRSEYGADFLWPFREGFRAMVDYYRSIRGRASRGGR